MSLNMRGVRSAVCTVAAVTSYLRMQLHVIAPQEGQEVSTTAAAAYRDAEPQMFLLYRRGHYDLLYPGDESWIGMDRIT